jgi:tetratricopeptide (TPR) repeat protein
VVRAANIPQNSSIRIKILLAILAALTLCLVALLPRQLQARQVAAHLDMGMALLKQGNVAEAEREWKAALQAAPENADAYQGLGRLTLAQGRLSDARDALNHLADLRPKEPHVLCELAALEYRVVATQAQSEAALQDATRAAALEPDCVRAQTVAGDACMDHGDQKRGLAYLRRAIQLKPEDVPLTLHGINRMLEANDLAGALAAARDLTRRYPGYTQGYALLATVCALYPRDSPEARSTEGLLLQALRFDPTNALAHARLGYVYLKADDARRAVAHLEAARLLHYQDASLLFNLSAAYRKMGRNADASRVERAFQQISRLENELSTLEKQAAMAPADAVLARRVQQTRAALETAQRASEEPAQTKTDSLPALPSVPNRGGAP